MKESKTITIAISGDPFKKWDIVRFSNIGKKKIVVDKKNQNHSTTLTIRNISKWRLIRIFQMIYFKIKYR